MLVISIIKNLHRLVSNSSRMAGGVPQGTVRAAAIGKIFTTLRLSLRNSLPTVKMVLSGYSSYYTEGIHRSPSFQMDKSYSHQDNPDQIKKIETNSETRIQLDEKQN